jgi:squalene-hopene/tetraprenyl-beta-curcumene cyclase
MREPSGIVFPAPQPSRRSVLRAARTEHARREAVRTTIGSSAEALLTMRKPDGYWCADLLADATLEADYILLQLWLYPPQGAAWNPPTRARIDKAVRTILSRQLPDGGWNIYAGGPSEVNATVRAYTVMKLAGMDTDQADLRRARERARALGGLQACNSYTKINFSFFGLFPRRYAPTVPPEIVIVPGDILYEVSSWTRAIVVPLSIVQALGGERPTPGGIKVEELFLPHKPLAMPRRDPAAAMFLYADRLVKLWAHRGLKHLRRAALREAEHWILDRTRYTGGLGAIYPAMMYTIMAFESLGYPDDHPDLVEAIRQFDNLILENGDHFEFQPCFSPIWDTAIAAFALGEAGQADPASLTATADWLLSKEIRRKGDWSVKRPDLPPGGWAFEFANEYYPDIDDTAMVLLALLHARASDPARQVRVEHRAIDWLIGMQSSDGGWAAFDVDNNWEVLNKIPFADHNAMLDPTCPDITGRVLEALCRRGIPRDHDAVRRGVTYLLRHQKSDGSWYGRWGVDYIYGTFLALRGLRTAGADAHPAMDKAAQWIRSVQNEDGGWGESCASYNKHRFVAAVSSASQTAWALLGLEATGDKSSAAVRRGVDYLIDTQRPDGTWHEELTTGTGFPNVFYLTYTMYRQYFPLLALAVCQE